jgi:uncharacterized damage-inducible protein DinB
MSPNDQPPVGERADLLQSLARHRHFLRYTVRDLPDEQARRAPTVSELTLGGLIKHVAITERQWIDFILDGPAVLAPDEASWAAHAEGFTMRETETLAELLDTYQDVARRTDELVRTLPDLDASQPLPEAPWFEPGARWSARRVLLHVIAETAQHAGHADILREAIDGSKTMG